MAEFYKTEVPFLRLVLFFIAGISCSIIYDLHLQEYWLLLGLINLLIIGYVDFFYGKHQYYLKTHIPGFSIYLCIFILGILLCNQQKEIDHSTHFSKFPSQKLIVCLIEDPKIKGDIAKFKVEVKQNIDHKKIISTSGKLLLALKFDTTQKLKLLGPNKIRSPITLFLNTLVAYHFYQNYSSLLV